MKRAPPKTSNMVLIGVTVAFRGNGVEHELTFEVPPGVKLDPLGVAFALTEELGNRLIAAGAKRMVESGTSTG